MTIGHPTELRLLSWIDAGRPEDAIAEHVRACGVCDTLTTNAGPPLEPSATPLEHASVHLPSPSDHDQDPEPGQVWRLRWNNTSLLALLWTVSDDLITAMPVTTDLAMSDDSTVILAGEDTAGLGPTAVWVGLEAAIGWHVLDVCWGNLPIGGIERVRHLVRTGKPVDLVDLEIGAQIISAIDERYEYRTVLADSMSHLVEACWVLEHGQDTLDGLLVAANIDLTDMLEHLGLPATERLRFKRGLRPLSSSEARRLSLVLGVHPTKILRTNPAIPNPLVAALDRPRWRHAVTQAARNAGIAESDERRQAAYAVLGLAARQSTFDDSEAQWHERLRHYFAP